MNRSRVSVYSLLFSLVIVGGGLVLWRRRHHPKPVVELPNGYSQPAIAAAQRATSMAMPSSAQRERSRPVGLITILASAGLVSWTGAQLLLLDSRDLLPPLLLYLIGAVCVVPMIGYYRGKWSEGEGSPCLFPRRTSDVRTGGVKRSIPILYWIGAAFFIILSILLAQTGMFSPLLVFCWVMGVALSFVILSEGQRLPVTFLYHRARSLLKRYEVINLIVFVGLAGGMQALTPSLSVSLVPSSWLQAFSHLFPLLLIPAVYLLGRCLGGRGTGLLAVGLAAASGWTLALGKLDGASGAAAVIGAMYIAGLVYAWRSGTRPAYLISGVLVGVGWLVKPEAGYLALLPGLMIVLSALDSRERLRELITHYAALLVIAGIVILPFALAPQPGNPRQREVPSNGLSASSRFLDGLSSSLLMFNLTSDPTPLHGIVNRPVFPPIMGAAFALGLLGWAAKVDGTRRWTGLWFVGALIISLIPSAMVEPPERYPNYLEAAMALPLAISTAGYGLWLIAHLMIERAGKVGAAFITVTFSLIVVLIAADAMHHYTNVFLPAYEQAANLLKQIRGE